MSRDLKALVLAYKVPELDVRAATEGTFLFIRAVANLNLHSLEVGRAHLKPDIPTFALLLQQHE